MCYFPGKKTELHDMTPELKKFIPATTDDIANRFKTKTVKKMIICYPEFSNTINRYQRTMTKVPFSILFISFMFIMYTYAPVGCGIPLYFPSHGRALFFV